MFSTRRDWSPDSLQQVRECIPETVLNAENVENNGENAERYR